MMDERHAEGLDPKLPLEEKEKLASKKEVEEKVKTLIDYLDAKTRLVNLVNKQKNKIKKEENK